MCLFEAKYIHIYPTFVDGLKTKKNPPKIKI